MIIIREHVVDLIEWLRPKGLKVCSYEKSMLNSKIKFVKQFVGTQKCYAQLNAPGVSNI